MSYLMLILPFIRDPWYNSERDGSNDRMSFLEVTGVYKHAFNCQDLPFDIHQSMYWLLIRHINFHDS